MRSGNSILGNIASFVRPAWELANLWQFWVVILAVISLFLCVFILYPAVIWLLFQAGRFIGFIIGGGS